MTDRGAFEGQSLADLSLSERVRAVALANERRRRRLVSRVLGSPLLRWRYGAPVADQLLIVPQDLRSADPSFAREVEFGQFGLAGCIAMLRGGSPFDIPAPNTAWLHALHGFGWLNHLDAADSNHARTQARQLATDWVRRWRHGTGLASRPDIAARRVISWLSHAHLLLEGADARTYETLTSSLGLQIVCLSASWRDAPVGYPRLLALTALVLADLCVAGYDRNLAGAERAFAAELNKQILPDGGHVSRNPQVLVEILLDLLPLRQCFSARDRTPPAGLDGAIRRMTAMLRCLRFGDGLLARFNGSGVPSPAALATVLAYGDPSAEPPTWAKFSNYMRLERGETIVIADVGGPPPIAIAADAHAGCLSFEMSSGTRMLFVNGGAPAVASADWRAASRATASHNALCLAQTSSATLIEAAAIRELVGGAPIRGPNRATAELRLASGAITATASHDGYAKPFNVIHRRHLALSDDGKLFSGVDTLDPVGARGVPLGREAPFAIHFHLHPEATCYHANPGIAAEVVLGNERQWRFSVEGATLSIEDSIYYADSAGPRPSLQIVLRGLAPDQSEVRWQVQCRD